MKWMVIVVAMLVLPLHAKVQTIRSASHLLLKLSAAAYSVAVFYAKEKHSLKNPELKQQIADMETMVRSLSQDPLYKNADLHFLLVDTSRSSYLPIMRSLQISKLPVWVIFRGRQQVGEKLLGFVDRGQITQEINDNLGTYMQERMKQKEYQLKQDLEKAKIRSFDQAYMWNSYWAPYWNLGYAPYWGFGWRPYNWWCY